MIEIAHSEVESFLICERRHFYNYGLAVRPKTVSDALYRGTLGHLALQTYYKAIIDGETRSSAIEAARASIFEDMTGLDSPGMIKIRINLFNILEAYFDFYKSEDWVPIEVEKQIKIELDDGLILPFTVDLIASTRQGYIVADHKFCYNFFQPQTIRLLPQLVKYRAALRQVGYKISGAAYNEVRYRELKDGYQFRRTPVSITDSRMDRTLSEHISVSRRIASRKSRPVDEWGNLSLRVANKFSCEKCPFETLCADDLDGRDRSVLLDSLFEPAPDRYAHIKLVEAE